MAAKLTPFQKKFDELDHLKKDALKVMAKFNALHLDYENWFKRQNRTFLNVLKTLQVSYKSLVPQQITTVQQYRTVVRVATEMSHNSAHRLDTDQLREFVVFWERFQQLKLELDTGVMQRFTAFCLSVQRLRQPEVRELVDQLYVTLNNHYSETFNFCSIHNEKDHLFTYSLSTSDSHFLGIVGYIPFLIGYATKACFQITKVHLEKL